MKFLRLTVAAFVSSAPGARRSVEQHLVPVALEHALTAPPTAVVSLKEGSSATSAAATLSTHVGSTMQPISDWLLVPPAYAADETPPSDSDIELLQRAMAAFYNPDKDMVKAEQLLTGAIGAWKTQPADEVAGLYRVRADCYMALLKPQLAQADYTKAIDLLTGPGGDLADPNELPAAYLGRARATRSARTQAASAASDYQLAIRLSSRDDYAETNADMEEDGCTRNPYAAWEWGSALRNAGNYQEAARVHAVASVAFDGIGDKARAIISQIDAGIDLASMSNSNVNIEDAKSVLTKGIARTTSVEGRDVALLQRIIAKEGEGRIALASILWSSDSKDRPAAEAQLGEACVRLEQLDVDAQARSTKAVAPTPDDGVSKLKFSIDDQAGAFEVSCSRFKNEKFLTETLQWPSSLQEKVQKLNNLSSQ
jgi:tetratricopeptide (TPR) repeat protein